MNDIVIHAFNATHDVIECDDAIAQELYDYFTYKKEGYEWIARTQNRYKNWNGDVHLFSKASYKLYVGFRSRLEYFAKVRSYTLSYASEVPGATSFSLVEAQAFIKSLNLPFEPRPYQLVAFVKAVRKRRLLTLSPTASGKSLIIYMLIRYLMSTGPWFHGDGEFSNGKSHTTGPHQILLIVPTLNLIHQMQSDFRSYRCGESLMHVIYEGQEKETCRDISISTWQSIYDMPKEFFARFHAIIVDEAHHAQADSIKKIMDKSVNTYHRYGYTGTLNDSETHRLVLEGLFGQVYVATTTKELMDQKYIAQLDIKAIVLKYPLDVSKVVSKLDYQDEINFLVGNERRNKFIQNLTLSLPENTILLFRLVDTHGRVLYENLKAATKRPVYYIHGGVEGEEREAIRQILLDEKEAILVGSFGTVSTGINWPSLRHVIFASPYRSKIKVLQSIGRGLRLDETSFKFDCTMYDIADDLSYKNKENHTLKHYFRRIEIYNEEEFQYKTYRVEMD